VDTPVFKNRNEQDKEMKFAINVKPMISSFAAQFAP
jgi:hypothetical protein